MAEEITPTQLEFRAAMSNLSAAVNIVTTDGISGKAGITVSAVCSVTDTPPTLLVCVNQRSYTHDIFRTNRRMAVNVLAPEHQEMAMHFSGATNRSLEERFALPGWDHASYGVPVLEDAAAVLVGRIGAEFTQGTHTIMCVEVDDIAVRSGSGGLVYFQRSFHDLAAPFSG
ncbi:flavin reductase [Nocardioides sp.]|uniref:flavin reductase n=1 Tax=Nocardioides sp. TaxID=35761 RepID=UPI0039E30811